MDDTGNVETLDIVVQDFAKSPTPGNAKLALEELLRCLANTGGEAVIVESGDSANTCQLQANRRRLEMGRHWDLPTLASSLLVETARAWVGGMVRSGTGEPQTGECELFDARLLVNFCPHGNDETVSLSFVTRPSCLTLSETVHSEASLAMLRAIRGERS